MKQQFFFLFIASLPCLLYADVCSNLIFTATGPNFTDSNFETMKTYFLKNINIEGKGGIVASPDIITPVGGGTYYYDWMRDGSISMRAFMQINDYDLNVITSNMDSYVNWIVRVQSENDPNGIDIRIDPKYNLPSGDVFTGGWGRPQIDGPGLRAATLSLYANELLRNSQKDKVLNYLWTNDNNIYHGGVIKYDLDWISQNWNQVHDSFDLWEDFQASDGFFWSKMNHRKALLIGAQLALQMGDNVSYKTYTRVASDITTSIETHWNGNFLIEAVKREKDSAVICALNLGYANDDFMKPTDYRIAQTVSVLNNLFCNSFKINQDDTYNNIPGILYGRYDGDVYQNGNPWVLLSANLATLFYRASEYIYDHKTGINQVLSDSEYNLWKTTLNIKDFFLSAQDRDLLMADSFIQAGDSVLQRIYRHVSGDGFHLAEQLDKNSGYQCSAKDLTWSYADVLVSYKQRKVLIGKKAKYQAIISSN